MNPQWRHPLRRALMRRSRLVPSLLLVSALAGLAASPTPTQAQTVAKTFSHPDRVRYDGQCITIDGRDTFIFSGSFHYFRCPKPLWRDRFQKIVDAGCNAVETYVPWNWHEREMPSSTEDFSKIDLSDLKEWLRMAHEEFGLYTIIRPGPYICAEWDDGGFPRWLQNKRPSGTPAGALWLRSDNPEFLAWETHWMRAVSPVIAAEQISRKAPGRPGVILFQIENEYDLFKEVPEAMRVPHLKALYAAAVAGGIDVPIFTCWTRQCRDSADPQLGQVFDAFNSYPRFKIEEVVDNLRKLRAQQPDAPLMISELQGGWFGHVGDKLSEDQAGLTPEQFTAHSLLAVGGGATLLNTYMVFGGTNFGYWGGRDQTTSYDYFAPIREPGGVGAKYAAFKAVGLMLKEYGPALARSRELACEISGAGADVSVQARRAADGTVFVFFRNRSVNTPARGTASLHLGEPGSGGMALSVPFDLGAFGLRVLRVPAGGSAGGGGDWLPKPLADPERPSADRIPGPVRVATAQMRADAGAADWIQLREGALLGDLGVFDGRTVMYTAKIVLPRSVSPAGLPAHAINADLADRRLHIEPPAGDRAIVEVNGHIVPAAAAISGNITPWLVPGENLFRILYLQGGLPNFGPGIEDRPGLKVCRLDAMPGADSAVVSNTPPGAWEVGRTLAGLAAGWQKLDAGAQPGWREVALDATRPLPRKSGIDSVPSGPSDALTTWFRSGFTLPAAVPGVWIPWHATVDAAGDGEIFLNGHSLGRYWEQGPQREFYLPECWLNFGGSNVLTLCLSPSSRGVRLRAIEIAPYAAQAELR